MFSNAGQIALTLLAAAPTALACLGYTGGLPKATGNVALTAPIYVKAGQVYDGGWRKFDRNPSSCNGQSEGGEKDTAFVVERGGTLRNVIIGKTVGEGVYCKGGGCNLEFIWFEDVCEDAISIVSGPVSNRQISTVRSNPNYRRTTVREMSPTLLVVVPTTPLTR